MCGIAGIVDFDGLGTHDKQNVKHMLNSLKHRGPNGSEIYQADNIALLSANRLSMVDIGSEHVLLLSNDKRFILAYNGEIYNYKELKDLACCQKYHFSTQSDGEIIFPLFETEGIKFLEKLNGMFAFSLWDNKEKKLLVARDRFGIKPLFYRLSNNRFIFASELKALADPSKDKISKEAVNDYLAMRFVPDPNTIYEGYNKIAPGSYAWVTHKGMEKGTFYELNNTRSNTLTPYHECLIESVKTTFHSDTKLGIFLSGGLDSTSVLAISHLLGISTETFSVGYSPISSTDEREIASSSAKFYDVSNRNIAIDDHDIRLLVERTLLSLDEPIYSTVAPSTFALSSLASRHVKGVLSGDGSDELLLSYKYIRNVVGSGERHWKENYIQNIGWLSNDIYGHQKSKINSLFESVGNQSWLEQIRYFEARYRLPCYHLARVDNLSMAHSLEVRLPFLNNTVTDNLMGLNAGLLWNGTNDKAILFDAVKENLPPIFLDKPKQPFTSPYERWVDTALKNDIDITISSKELYNQLNLCHYTVSSIWDNHKAGTKKNYPAVWGFYMILKWLQVRL